MSDQEHAESPAAKEKLQYTPLDSKRSIRLLRCLDQSPDDNRQRFSLEQFSLDHCPKYSAISYTWGAPTLSDEEMESETGYNKPGLYEEIECNHQFCLVNENLFEALRYLSKSHEVEYLWADALCINQWDLHEREEQVLLMGDIYTLALNVIVWLSSGDLDLEDFLWLHTTYMPTLDRIVDDIGWNNLVQRSPFDPALRTVADRELSMVDWYRRWWAYFRFYRRMRWFNRAWVVQEVSLARNIVVRCGDVLLSWRTMSALAQLVLWSGWAQALAPERYQTKTAGLDGLMAISLVQQVHKVSGSLDMATGFWQQAFRDACGARTNGQIWHFYVLWAIDSIRMQQATDPRDHVYAILGIAERSAPPQLLGSIRPDYSSSTEDVFIRVAKMFLQRIPLLCLLSALEDKSDTKLTGLPSWVPDWTAESKGQSRLSWTNANGVPRYNTSRVGEVEESPCKIQGKVLILQGACFDSVTEVSMPVGIMATTYNMLSWLEFCTCMAPTYDPTGEPRQEVLWRTMIANADVDGTEFPARPSCSSLFRDWAEMILPLGLYQRRTDIRAREVYLDRLSHLEELSSDGTASLLPRKDQVVQEAATLAEKLDGDYDERFVEFVEKMGSKGMTFGMALGEAAGLRRLYRTSRGYVGLGPASLKAQDEVWLIRGSRVPMALRSQRSRCDLTMLGEAYLHGFMHGEMLDSVGERLATVEIR